jgi:hypothetical protein
MNRLLHDADNLILGRRKTIISKNESERAGSTSEVED